MNIEKVNNEEIDFCISWILTHARYSTKVCKDYGSYTLKHFVESELKKNKNIKRDYVSNESFIFAAKYLGYKLYPIPKTPNYYFNMKFPKRYEERFR